MKKVLMFIALLATALANAQSLRITSPNGNEVWNTGYTWPVKWTPLAATNIDIDYSTDGGSTWTNIISNQPASVGTYNWDISASPSLSCWVRIKESAGGTILDMSDQRFIIGPIAYVGTSGDTSMCSNDRIQLTASAVLYDNKPGGGGPPPPPPGFTYSWSPAIGLSDPNIANPFVTGLTGNTTFTVTADDGQGNMAQNTVTVSVLPTPLAGIQATNTTANYLRLDSMEVRVTGAQAVSYNWTVNDLPVGINSPGLTYNYPGEFVCRVVSALGCADTESISIIGAITVTVDSFADPTCANSNNGYIAVSATGGNGLYSYDWSNGDRDHLASGLSGGRYSVVAHDLLGNVGFLSKELGSPLPIQVQVLSQLDGVFPDTLELAAAGGAGPLSYNWSNGATTAATIIMSKGVYGYTITDANSCQLAGQATLGAVANDDFYEIPKNLSVQLPVMVNDSSRYDGKWYPYVQDAYGAQNGSTFFLAGVGITYTPNSGYTGADSFSYVVCLADSGSSLTVGYCDTAVVRLSIIDSISISLVSIQQPLCAGYCDGQLEVIANGGTAPYTYLWNNFVPGPIDSNLCAGVYTVTVLDANNLSAVTAFTISQGASSLNLQRYGDTLYAYTNSPDSWIFQWSTGDIDTGFSSIIEARSPAAYCVAATNVSTGCILQACDTLSSCLGCVWPGDADDNTIADNNDLLAVGIGYGATGTPRALVSNQWTGQPSADWPQTLLSGSNYKHIDCNGDGNINADDTLAIVQNFGKTHIRGGAGRKQWMDGKPELSVKLSPDTVKAGDVMTATLSLGDVNNQAIDVYGLAFTLNYDLAIVDTTQTSVTFNNSWLANAGDMLSIAHDEQNGQIKMAITRFDHTMRTGYGKLATVSFIITTDNINGKNLGYYGMQGWISNLKVIDSQGNYYDYNEGLDSANIEYSPTGIDETDADSRQVKVFPNPANGQVTLELVDKTTINEIVVTGLLGNTVLLEKPATGYRSVLNVSQLNTGTYFVEVKTDKGSYKKRIVIAR